VRRRNLLPEDAYPCRMLTGATLEHMTINRTLEEAVERAEYAVQRVEQQHARANGELIGIGVCTYLEPGPGPTDYAQALGFTYEQRSMQRARVRVDIDGTATVFTSQQPHGQSHETTLAQLVADELGLAIDAVRVVHGNTELQPFNLVATGGSRAATLASGAVVGAARIVRGRVVAVVADLLEAAAEDLELVDGVIRVKGSPSRLRSLADVARLSVLAPFTLSSELRDGLDASFDFETPAGGWTQSTHICTVAIDPDTGEVAILRYVVVEDCGRMINPAVVDGQIRGGIAQGIGAVLFERIVYDDVGQNRTTTFQDYLVPTALDVPTIEIHHLQGPDQGAVPYRGVGEGGAIGAPAAVTNAIEDALWHFGARVRSQYLPPAQILGWIR
jgi:carbon-monoxide dehydrogenase large subunit